jgi:predicted Fe-Mo cluster-binding NifX family protein
VSFWLAKSQRQFLETAAVEAVVATALGQEAADALFARMKKTVLASDSIDVIPRLDLSSKSL